MAHFHKDLTQEKWGGLSRDKQILNIASELARSKNWLKKKDEKYMRNSMDRAIELIDLTINDRKWREGGLTELLRFREFLGEFYVGINKDARDFIRLIKVFLQFDSRTAGVEILK